MKLLTLTFLFALPTLSYGFPPGYADKATKVKSDPNSFYKGIVKETKTIGNYTYAKIKGKDGDKWVATSTTKINVGDQVEFLKGQTMKDFHSKGLKKTFKEIYFSSSIKVLKSSKPMKSAVKKGSIKKLNYSIANIFEQAKTLKNKKVKLRAVVVKFSPSIMGKNWVHIQDGTNHKSQFDLVVTTQDKVKKGDTIIVDAKVAIDKDFGYGYKYPVLLENAKLRVE